MIPSHDTDAALGIGRRRLVRDSRGATFAAVERDPAQVSRVEDDGSLTHGSARVWWVRALQPGTWRLGDDPDPETAVVLDWDGFLTCSCPQFAEAWDCPHVEALALACVGSHAGSYTLGHGGPHV